ncbi:MAG: hypothetical protein WC208_09560 [Gallionella sp.]
MKNFLPFIAFFAIWYFIFKAIGNSPQHKYSKGFGHAIGILSGVIAFVITIGLIAPTALPNKAESATAEITSKSEYKGIGVSYDQVMQNLDSVFTMESNPLADGTPRMTGQKGLNILEINGGNKGNIDSVSLMVMIPNDNAESVAMSTLLVFILCKNALPEWDAAAKWITSSMDKIGRSKNKDHTSEQIVHGDKIIKVGIVKALGIVNISIRNKDAINK